MSFAFAESTITVCSPRNSTTSWIESPNRSCRVDTELDISGGFVGLEVLPGRLRRFDLFLESHETLEKCLGTWRTPGNVDIDRDEIVDSLKDRVAAIHSTGGSTGTHGDAPFRLGHLVPDALHGEGHLVGDGAGDDHDVGLPR